MWEGMGSKYTSLFDSSLMRSNVDTTRTDTVCSLICLRHCSGYDTLLFPYRILTHSDGRVWERRQGHARENRDDEDLTDDEEGGAGYI